MRSSFFVLSLCVGLGLTAVACGDAEGDDDAGGSSGAPSQNDGGGSSSGSSSGATQQDVTVVIAGESLPVSFAGLQTTTFKDQTVVTLPTVWTATGTSARYQDYVFKFVGADGFRPESRPNCAEVVFDGAAFEQGYIDVASHRLVWEDALGYSGCAFVSDLVTIEAVAP